MRPTRKPKIRIFHALAALLLTACATAHKPNAPSTPPPAATPATLTPLPLIPHPVTLDRAAGTFELRDGATLRLRSPSSDGHVELAYFADLAARTHNLHFNTQAAGEGTAADGAIEFELNPSLALPPAAEDEGYELTVSPHGVHAAARTAHGLFNAGVTLWQLLDASGGSHALPSVHIVDYPRFRWRGLMLDSARHFQAPEEVERVLDQMAELKLNVLHWHLTDDQGWRIEIKKYPRLTSIGAWRNDAAVGAPGARYGGFYTQDQIRHIVAYAAARHIAVVPEIEMPGHAQAAIAAYPRFGAAKKRPAVSHDWGVHTYLYNVDDGTFAFLEDVLGETLALFPSPYIHVGGDEAAKDQWQASAAVQARRRKLGLADEAKLQGWFTARIEKWLAAHGRSLVGWDEILEGGVPARAVVMSWRGTEGGVAAARAGHDVIMSPSPQLYFDHVQSTRPDEPPGRPDPVTLQDVYAYEAVPAGLDGAAARHVLGAQANLWSEYLDTPAKLEHAAFPRAAALAEALWTPPAARRWDEFLARLPAQMQRYRQAGVAAADSVFAGESHPQPGVLRSDELQPCGSGGLPLRLPGPARDGAGGVYRVNLFDPCWLDPAVDLSAARRLNFVVGALPFNFQLWHDAKNVRQRTPAGHLQVRLDSCDGELLADRALQRGAGADVQRITLDLPPRGGAHALCVRLNRTNADPLWALDRIETPP